MPKNITIIHSSGSEHVSTSDEESSGVQISQGSHDDDYTEEGSESLDDLDEEEYDFAEDLEGSSEIEPSDSASRPREPPRRRSQPAALPRPPPQPARRPQPREHAAPEAPRHRRQRREYPRDRSEHSVPRRRPLSDDLDDVAYEDDYPGYPPRGPLPHHPHNQWSHVPQHSGPPTGYTHSMISGAPYQPNPFGQGMERALVPMPPNDPYGYPGNPFAAGSHAGGNPFSPQNQSMVGGYFEPPHPRSGMDHRPPMGRQRHSIHGGMSGQPGIHPAGSMMPYYTGFDQHYGMPPHMPPPFPPYHRGYGRSPDRSPPPGRRDRSRSKPPSPPPISVPAAGPPPPPPPPAALGPPIPLEPTPAEKEAADRLKKLEELIMAQAKAKADKEAAKLKAAADAAAAEELAKKRGEEDKLLKLHELIIAQREEQKARDQAIEAARAAEKAEADAKAAKEAAEKQKAAEDAAKLLAAAKKAREEAEAKAADEAKAAKEAHEKALAEAAAAAEELKKAKEEAEKKAAEEAKAKEEAEKKAAAAAAPPPEEKKPPIKFKDAVGRKFSFPWHLCCTWKGMEELIKQAFLHVDVIGQHVHEGHYDLVGPDGEIILPQVWETMVQPDWTITMHMWPMEDPMPKSPPPPPPGIPGLDGPWVDLPPPPLRHPSKGKGRGGGPDKIHKMMGDPPMPKPGKPRGGGGGRDPFAGMPPPPPPPPVPMAFDVGGPDIQVISPGPGPSAIPVKPKKKAQPNVGFLRWTAGGGVRTSGKGAKKPESPTGGGGPTASGAGAHHSAHNGNADAGCVLM